MILSKLLKSGVTSILLILSITLLISACNNKEPAETTGNNIDPGASDTSTDIKLSWVAPSAREDNKPISLSEIAGYKIYYGTIPNDYPNSVDINDGSADSYTFKSFSTGTYYFTLTTYDTEGRESRQSRVVRIAA